MRYLILLVFVNIEKRGKYFVKGCTSKFSHVAEYKHPQTRITEHYLGLQLRISLITKLNFNL